MSNCVVRAEALRVRCGELETMGVRDWANTHPKAVAGIMGVCILAAAGGIAVEVFGNRHSINTNIPDDFFSVDNGNSYFRAPGNNAPPFTYQGQTAVRAHVFSCGGTTFVGYLDRYKPAALKIEQAGGVTPPWVDISGRELKRPGDKDWVSSDNKIEVAKILNVKCPDGSSSVPDPIEP